jgi:hypothetical protein
VAVQVVASDSPLRQEQMVYKVVVVQVVLTTQAEMLAMVVMAAQGMYGLNTSPQLDKGE